jgi:hypothetical protein
MYIRSLIGAYKGEIRDVAYDSARRLIDLGEATAVYDDPQVRSERVESVFLEGHAVTSTDTVQGPSLVSIEPPKKTKRH